MTTTIWKFPFEIADVVRVKMPVGAKVLKIDSQHGTPTMWALVNAQNDVQVHEFRLYGTGHPVDVVGSHIATFFHGPLVWHVFAPNKPDKAGGE